MFSQTRGGCSYLQRHTPKNRGVRPRGVAEVNVLEIQMNASGVQRQREIIEDGTSVAGIPAPQSPKTCSVSQRLAASREELLLILSTTVAELD